MHKWSKLILHGVLQPSRGVASDFEYIKNYQCQKSIALDWFMRYGWNLDT